MVEGQIGTNDSGTPPHTPAPLPREPAKWPTVIGVISLIYAIIGLSCQVLANGWVVAQPYMPEFMGGGVEQPAIFRWLIIATLVISLGLGILMLRGAISLLHRHPVGVRRLRLWAVLRLVVLVVGVVASVLTFPAQIQYQRNIQAGIIERFGDDMPPGAMPIRSDEQLWRQQTIGVAVSTGIISIYPLFLGFFLYRKSVDEEMGRWMLDDWDDEE